MDKALGKERLRGQKCPYCGVGRKDLARISHEEFIWLCYRTQLPSEKSSNANEAFHQQTYKEEYPL
jgi:hypothetical protein